jgi:competence protein ComEC
MERPRQRSALVEEANVHHHGSSDSSGAQILEQMEPTLALIPVGAGNSYGHPDQGVLRRLESAGAEVLRTDLDGDLRVVGDGVGVLVGEPASMGAP